MLAERKRDLLATLGERLSGSATPAELAYLASAILGEALDASRVGIGRLNMDSGTVQIERDWTAPGAESLSARWCCTHSACRPAELRQGELMVVPDLRLDHAHGAGCPCAGGPCGARAGVRADHGERGTGGLFFVHADQVRSWEPEELSLIDERVGQRARMFIERPAGSSTCARPT